jgi:hypothetical protein
MKRYARAVIRRAVGRVAQAVGKRRVMVTAERGGAAVALLDWRRPWGVTCISWVNAGPPVSCQGQWGTLGTRRLRGHAQPRRCGALASGERGHNAAGSPRGEPETPRAPGALGMWGAIALLLPTQRPRHTVVALAVQEAVVMRHGGWVLPRRA